MRKEYGATVVAVMVSLALGAAAGMSSRVTGTGAARSASASADVATRPGVTTTTARRGNEVVRAETVGSGTEALGAATASGIRSYATALVGAAMIKPTPSHQGFFILSPDGSVHGYGDAVALGNAHLPHRAVTMAVTTSGRGYWVFDANGCVAAFGDAAPPSRTICGVTLNGPIIDASTTPSGQGYWLVAADGGMFAFGDAPFAGSMGGRRLNAPVVGMAASPAGGGYWEVATDGGVFAFGVPFYGSTGSLHLNRPVVGMVASGFGYLLGAADGGVFNFGNPFFGSLGANPPASTIVAIASSTAVGGQPNGYWMLDGAGAVYGFGSAWLPGGAIPAPAAPVCGLSQVAFCDTFDSPAGRGDRAGGLNGVVWGVSRATSNDNLGQGVAYNWASVGRDTCGTTEVVHPETDVTICGGRAVEGVNDNTNQTVLAMYPRQPFDIANRTGRVAFDVSDNTQGPHAAWPEFVYTDQPVPAPLATDLSGVSDSARNSLAISFAAAADGCCGTPSGTQQATCVGVDQIGITANYRHSAVAFRGDGCVLPSTSLTSLNHVEIQLSPTGLKVYMSDAGTVNMHLVADASLTMPLTRGLVWMEDVHYNAAKFNSQQTNTFAWDNFGFDGPVLPRDLGFDVLDNMDPGGSAANGLSTANLGYRVPGGGPLTFTVHGVNNVAKASGALLEFTYWPQNAQTITYNLNGGPPHQFAWPFGDGGTYSSQTVAMPVPPSELHEGDNVVTVSTSDPGGVDIANIDVILQGAGGVVAP